MAEEFQSSGNWWEGSRSRYEGGISPSSSSMTTFVEQSNSTTAAGDPNSHIMGLGLDWNQPNFRNNADKAVEGSFRSMLQETGQEQQQWMRTDKIYSAETPAAEFKQINRGFSLDDHNQQQQQAQFTPFPMDGGSTATLYGNSATLLQGLLGGEQQQHQQGINFPYSAHLGINSAELMAPASWSASKVPQFLRNSPPKGAATPPHNQLQFSNNTPFWNASDIKHVRPTYFTPPYNTQPFSDKSKISEVGDSGTVRKKSGNDHNQQTGAAAKRPRNETPSPLPAFKVRKEKMGDRITALQQLVSPFGKTDTASVLSEAIEYIKFLHEQVSVLSTPYLKSGEIQQQHPQSREKTKDGEGGKQDLRSRGLCLVPVSSTFPVTHETTVDFWTPTFGGTFR